MYKKAHRWTLQDILLHVITLYKTILMAEDCKTGNPAKVSWRDKAVLSLCLKILEGDKIVLPFPIPTAGKMGQWDSLSPSCLCKVVEQDPQGERTQVLLSSVKHPKTQPTLSSAQQGCPATSSPGIGGFMSPTIPSETSLHLPSRES